MPNHSHHRESSQIAITGLGLVSPLGNSLDLALARARRGESGIRAYTADWGDDPQLRQRVGGTVEDFDPAPLLDPHLAARHEPAVLYALAAAHEALSRAGLLGALDPERSGCVIGSGLPGAELWHRALHTRPVPRMTAVAITGNAAAGLGE